MRLSSLTSAVAGHAACKVARACSAQAPRLLYAVPTLPYSCPPTLPSHLVVLAPVHVGAARHARRVEHMGGLDLRGGGQRRQHPCWQLWLRGGSSTPAQHQSAPASCTRSCQPTAAAHPLDVGDDGGTVLQARSAVLKLGALLLQDLAHQAACGAGRAQQSASSARQLAAPESRQDGRGGGGGGNGRGSLAWPHAQQ